MLLGYTPPTDILTVEVDGPAPTLANECSQISQASTNCTFNITEDGIYEVRLNTTNVIGTTSVYTTWNCKCMCILKFPVTKFMISD